MGSAGLISQVPHRTFQILDAGSGIGKMDRRHIHGHELLDDGVAGVAETVGKTSQFVGAEGFRLEARLLDTLHVLVAGSVELVELGIELAELGAEVVELAGVEAVGPVVVDLGIDWYRPCWTCCRGCRTFCWAWRPVCRGWRRAW
jgi:hypothetical protein